MDRPLVCPLEPVSVGTCRCDPRPATRSELAVRFHPLVGTVGACYLLARVAGRGRRCEGLPISTPPLLNPVTTCDLCTLLHPPSERGSLTSSHPSVCGIASSCRFTGKDACLLSSYFGQHKMCIVLVRKRKVLRSAHCPFILLYSEFETCLRERARHLIHGIVLCTLIWLSISRLRRVSI